jgi:hypothetical protein
MRQNMDATRGKAECAPEPGKLKLRRENESSAEGFGVFAQAELDGAVIVVWTVR